MIRGYPLLPCATFTQEPAGARLGAVRLGELRRSPPRSWRDSSRCSSRSSGASDVTPTETTSRLGYGNAIAGLVIALLAPILGRHRRSRRAPQAIHVRLDLVRRGAPPVRCTSSARASGSPALALFVLGTIGFNGGVVFNDSLLLDVAQPRELDRVSAFGYCAGLSRRRPAVPRQRADGQQAGAVWPRELAPQAVQVSFVTVAVWWLLFTIPVMRGVREQQRGPHLAVRRGHPRRIPRTRQYHRAPAPVPHDA